MSATATATARPDRAGAAGRGMGVSGSEPFDELLVAFEATVDQVVAVDVDACDEDQVGQVAAATERQVRRLRSLQARLAATLTRRRAAAARAERPDDPRAPEHAARQVRRELTDRLAITPSEAKRMTRTGRQLAELPTTAAAHGEGRLTDRHVGVIAEVTAHVSGAERAAFEAELVELAGRCRDAVVFGRHARGRLIERDHDAAMADLERAKARRRAAVTQTEHGTTLLRLETAGLDGELVHTVIDAFRTPDGTGLRRTAEQRTHDALVAALQTALRAGTASTQHGVRPQVAVVIRAESVRDGDGAARTRWTGPLPYAEVARVLGDCRLTRIVADATDLPLTVSRKVRTVPAGLWDLLVVRDGGCIWPGCDAPAGWCQVAHLTTPYVEDGKLAPGTAGLLCTTGPNHHAIYDRLGHTVRWIDGRPHVCTPEGQLLSELPHSARAARGGLDDQRLDPGGSDFGRPRTAGPAHRAPRVVRERSGAYRVAPQRRPCDRDGPVPAAPPLVELPEAGCSGRSPPPGSSRHSPSARAVQAA